MRSHSFAKPDENRAEFQSKSSIERGSFSCQREIFHRLPIPSGKQISYSGQVENRPDHYTGHLPQQENAIRDRPMNNQRILSKLELGRHAQPLRQ
jgi:hypothetical protein